MTLNDTRYMIVRGQDILKSKINKVDRTNSVVNDALWLALGQCLTYMKFVDGEPTYDRYIPMHVIGKNVNYSNHVNKTDFKYDRGYMKSSRIFPRPKED